jgi:hypothetical protein
MTVLERVILQTQYPLQRRRFDMRLISPAQLELSKFASRTALAVTDRVFD